MCYLSNKKIVLLGGVSSMMINFRKELIIDFVNANNKVYCLAQGYTECEKKLISSWGATAIDSPLDTKSVNPFKDIVSAYRLLKIFNELSPDIVFSYFVKPVIWGSIIANIAKVPKVVGMIEGLGNSFTNYKHSAPLKNKMIKKVQVFLYKISLPYLDNLILLNTDDKKDLIDKYNIKVKSITILGPIGVDLNKFSYSRVNDNNISFIFVARLLKEKGVFEYLEAAKIVKEEHPDVGFYMIGGFDKENPFSLKKEELDFYIENKVVIYPGHVDNVYDWISKSSVFVLPSYREGFPRSIQEAMSIGRPIITTDNTGCKDTVIEGINGFLVPPFSSSAIAEKMLFFIDNPDKINIMGLESRKIAEERYNVYDVNKKIISIIFDS